jgi:hypothetical protein
METQEQAENKYLKQVLQNTINQKINTFCINEIKNAINKSLSPNLSLLEVRQIIFLYNYFYHCSVRRYLN